MSSDIIHCPQRHASGKLMERQHETYNGFITNVEWQFCGGLHGNLIFSGFNDNLIGLNRYSSAVDLSGAGGLVLNYNSSDAGAKLSGLNPR